MGVKIGADRDPPGRFGDYIHHQDYNTQLKNMRLTNGAPLGNTGLSGRNNNSVNAWEKQKKIRVGWKTSVHAKKVMPMQEGTYIRGQSLKPALTLDDETERYTSGNSHQNKTVRNKFSRNILSIRTNNVVQKINQ